MPFSYGRSLEIQRFQLLSAPSVLHCLGVALQIIQEECWVPSEGHTNLQAVREMDVTCHVTRCFLSDIHMLQNLDELNQNCTPAQLC